MNPTIDYTWIAVASVVIGAVARLSKDDIAFLPSVSGRWRPLLVLALGMVSAALQSLSDGVPWRVAVAGGIVASVTAITGHEVVVERMRGGREFGDDEPRKLCRPLLLGVAVISPGGG